MTTVRELLQRKGGKVWTIHPDQYVIEAIQLMAHENLGALVVALHGKVLGMISERDYARKVILMGASSMHTFVREIMTDMVYYLRPEQGVVECLAMMTDKRCRHLPVLDQDRLIGIVTIGDVVKEMLAERGVMFDPKSTNVVRGGRYV